MNTMQLECFLAVAETLNFAKAAQQLNVTQPAVTQQIHSLEQELNVKLFNRTTRTVELTRAGLMFINDAKSILNISQRAKKRAENYFEDTRKAFIIGCHSHNDVYQLSGVLEQMLKQFPQIYPVFQVVPFRHLYQRLVEENVDVVVAFQESGLKDYITYKELAKIKPTAVLSATHPLAKRRELYIDDLKQEKVIVVQPPNCPGAIGKVQMQIIEDKSALDIYVCDAMETSVVMARAGYGVAIVPSALTIRSDALAYIPIEDAQLMSYGVYYKKLSGHPELKEFVNLAKEYFVSNGKF